MTLLWLTGIFLVRRFGKLDYRARQRCIGRGMVPDHNKERKPRDPAIREKFNTYIFPETLSFRENKDDYIFTVTENNVDVAMVLVEKSGEVYINEQARERLKTFWPETY